MRVRNSAVYWRGESIYRSFICRTPVGHQQLQVTNLLVSCTWASSSLTGAKYYMLRWAS
jgi:hypothetical protein